MQAVGIIPARLQSSRLPRKLLLQDTGRPLIQYAWEAAGRAETLDEVIVATDSPEIAEAVWNFGGRCEMTGEHPSGTDRIAEVAERCCPQAEIVVNIQGDEPEIDPRHIDLLVDRLRQHPAAEMATLATPIRSADDRDDPSCVKVVCTSEGRALYFSRAAIPFVRDDDWSRVEGERPVSAGRWHRGADASRSPGTVAERPVSPWWLHLGIYAYRRKFLLELTRWSPSRLEQWEKLEQLRALEAGATIQVALVEHPSVGIDTPDDYARFVERMGPAAA